MDKFFLKRLQCVIVVDDATHSQKDGVDSDTSFNKFQICFTKNTRWLLNNALPKFLSRCFCFSALSPPSPMILLSD